MAISVFLADDNLIVREGVKALLDLEDDLDVVGVASDYDELVAGAEAANPQVVVRGRVAGHPKWMGSTRILYRTYVRYYQFRVTETTGITGKSDKRQRSTRCLSQPTSRS
jgi:DNA-binding NarL/FixJ family response regulator